MVAKIYADKSLENHLEALRSGGAGSQEGWLLGSAGNHGIRIATFLPIAGAGSCCESIQASLLSSFLPGGLRVVGVFSFSASQQNHTPRLAQLCCSAAVGVRMMNAADQSAVLSRTRADLDGKNVEDKCAVLMIYAANRLKCFCVQGNGVQSPTEARFQKDISKEYRIFKAKVGPILVYEKGRSSISSAVRKYLDLHYAHITIDDVVIPPVLLTSKCVGDIPSRQPYHKVSFQTRRKRRSNLAAIDGQVREPITFQGVFTCFALVHESESLICAAGGLQESAVLTSCNMVSGKATSQAAKVLSMFLKENLDKAVARGFLLGVAGDCSNCILPMQKLWASFAPASAGKSYVESDSKADMDGSVKKEGAASTVVEERAPASIEERAPASDSLQTKRKSAKDSGKDKSASAYLYLGAILAIIIALLLHMFRN